MKEEILSSEQIFIGLRHGFEREIQEMRTRMLFIEPAHILAIILSDLQAFKRMA